MSRAEYICSANGRSMEPDSQRLYSANGKILHVIHAVALHAVAASNVSSTSLPARSMMVAERTAGGPQNCSIVSTVPQISATEVRASASAAISFVPLPLKDTTGKIGTPCAEAHSLPSWLKTPRNSVHEGLSPQITQRVYAEPGPLLRWLEHDNFRASPDLMAILATRDLIETLVFLVNEVFKTLKVPLKASTTKQHGDPV